MYITMQTQIGLKEKPKESTLDWSRWICKCGANNYCPAVDFNMFAFPSYPYMADRRDEIVRAITRVCYKCGSIWANKHAQLEEAPHTGAMVPCSWCSNGFKIDASFMQGHRFCPYCGRPLAQRT